MVGVRGRGAASDFPCLYGGTFCGVTDNIGCRACPRRQRLDRISAPNLRDPFRPARVPERSRSSERLSARASRTLTSTHDDDDNERREYRPRRYLTYSLGYLQANALKDQGNKAFAAKQYDTAVDLFTKAIALDPSNHVLYSNRSAALAGKRQWNDALADAQKASRHDAQTLCADDCASALRYLRNGRKATRVWAQPCTVCSNGTKPSPRTRMESRSRTRLLYAKVSAKSKMRKVCIRRHMSLNASLTRCLERESSSGGDAGIGKMFADPNLFAKLAANPKTSALLADPSFMMQLRAIQQNPALAGKYVLR